jgi:hypothetical protein
MNKRLSPLEWTTLGAGLMYVFDPGYGKRRHALVADEEIVFNASSHWQTARMRYEDFARLVQPRIAAFTQPLYVNWYRNFPAVNSFF